MPAQILSFTNAAIKALPIPATGEAVYRDKNIPQLYLRVYPSGRKTFSLVVWLPERKETHREPVGTFPALSAVAAEMKARKLLGKLAEGVVPSEQRRKDRQRVRFSALFGDFMERRGNRLKTAKEMKATYERYLRRPLGDRPASEIKRSELASLHGDITKRGAPVAANRAIALVSSVYGWAMKMDLAEDNPARKIARNEERARTRFVLPSELDAFFRSVAAEPDTAMRDYILFSVYTGQRKNEILAMRWSHIDFHEAIWRIPDTKNGTPHEYPLPMKALDLLEQRWSQRVSDFVFPGQGRTGHIVEPKKAWYRIKARMEALALRERLMEKGASEIEKWEDRFANAPEDLVRALQAQARARGIEVPPPFDLRLHDLRRTNGSYQAMTGASLPIIGKALNHKSQRSTEIYARVQHEAAREAVETALDAMENRYRQFGPRQARAVVE